MELFVKRLMLGEMSLRTDDRKKIKCVFIRQTAGTKKRMYEKVLRAGEQLRVCSAKIIPTLRRTSQSTEGR